MKKKFLILVSLSFLTLSTQNLALEQLNQPTSCQLKINQASFDQNEHYFDFESQTIENFASVKFDSIGREKTVDFKLESEDSNDWSIEIKKWKKLDEENTISLKVGTFTKDTFIGKISFYTLNGKFISENIIALEKRKTQPKCVINQLVDKIRSHTNYDDVISVEFENLKKEDSVKIKAVDLVGDDWTFEINPEYIDNLDKKLINIKTKLGEYFEQFSCTFQVLVNNELINESKINFDVFKDPSVNVQIFENSVSFGDDINDFASLSWTNILESDVLTAKIENENQNGWSFELSDKYQNDSKEQSIKLITNKDEPLDENFAADLVVFANDQQIFSTHFEIEVITKKIEVKKIELEKDKTSFGQDIIDAGKIYFDNIYSRDEKKLTFDLENDSGWSLKVNDIGSTKKFTILTNKDEYKSDFMGKIIVKYDGSTIGEQTITIAISKDEPTAKILDLATEVNYRDDIENGGKVVLTNLLKTDIVSAEILNPSQQNWEVFLGNIIDNESKISFVTNKTEEPQETPFTGELIIKINEKEAARADLSIKINTNPKSSIEQKTFDVNYLSKEFFVAELVLTDFYKKDKIRLELQNDFGWNVVLKDNGETKRIFFTPKWNEDPISKFTGIILVYINDVVSCSKEIGINVNREEPVSEIILIKNECIFHSNIIDAGEVNITSIYPKDIVNIYLDDASSTQTKWSLQFTKKNVNLYSFDLITNKDEYVENFSSKIIVEVNGKIIDAKSIEIKIKKDVFGGKFSLQNRYLKLNKDDKVESFLVFESPDSIPKYNQINAYFSDEGKERFLITINKELSKNNKIVFDCKTLNDISSEKDGVLIMKDSIQFKIDFQEGWSESFKSDIFGFRIAEENSIPKFKDVAFSHVGSVIREKTLKNNTSDNQFEINLETVDDDWTADSGILIGNNYRIEAYDLQSGEFIPNLTFVKKNWETLNNFGSTWYVFNLSINGFSKKTTIFFGVKIFNDNYLIGENSVNNLTLNVEI